MAGVTAARELTRAGHGAAFGAFPSNRLRAPAAFARFRSIRLRGRRSVRPRANAARRPRVSASLRRGPMRQGSGPEWPYIGYHFARRGAPAAGRQPTPARFG